ncbi:MAG: hypothetical protein ACTS47_00740 [Candidatus Hodgkinia cicadicola]
MLITCLISRRVKFVKTVNEFRMESYNSMNEVNGAKLTNDWRLSAIGKLN